LARQRRAAIHRRDNGAPATDAGQASQW